MYRRQSVAILVTGLIAYVIGLCFQLFTVNDAVDSAVRVGIYATPAATCMILGSQAFAMGWFNLRRPSHRFLFTIALTSLAIVLFILVFFDFILALFSSNILVPVYLMIDSVVPLFVAFFTVFVEKVGKHQNID